MEATSAGSGSATEQSVATVAEYPVGLLQHIGDETAPELFNWHPIIEIAFKNDMWWALPPCVSKQMIQMHTAGEDAIYTWDWGNTRTGSWMPDGEETSINRYKVDLVQRLQTNLDNGRQRSVRVVLVRKEDVVARSTGHLPP